MPIAQSTGAHALVIGLFHRSKSQVLPLADLCDFFEDFFILFIVCRPP